MMTRLLKLALAVFVALQGLLYGLQNLVNLQAAHQAVAFSISQDGHEIYTRSVLPGIDSSFLIWMVLGVIIALELLIGLVGLAGAWKMGRSLGASSDQFRHASRAAVAACGLAMIVWFGLFMVGGGAGFQMWQTEAGGGALRAAFSYAAISGLVLLIIQQRE